MSDKKVEKLARKASKGNDKAFRELCEKKSRSILYNAYSILKNTHDAEDAAQEVYIKMYKYIKTLKDPSELNAWLLKIVKNECFSIFKKKTMRNEDLSTESNLHIIEDVEEDNKEFLPQEFVEDKELRKILLQVIDDLPTRRRMVINMYYFDEMSYKEIAQVMDISVGTVSSNILRAKDQIKEELERRTSEPIKSVSPRPVATMPVIAAALNMDANKYFPPEISAKIANSMIDGIISKSSVWLSSLKDVILTLIITVAGTAVVTAGIVNIDAPNVMNVNNEPAKEKEKGYSKIAELKTAIFDIHDESRLGSQRKKEETFAAIENEGELVFRSEDCNCGHVNPKSSSVENINLPGITYTWEIFNEGNGSAIYNGNGKEISSQYDELYENNEDGHYLVVYSCKDEKGNMVYVKRNFIIDTNEIFENQYE